MIENGDLFQQVSPSLTELRAIYFLGSKVVEGGNMITRRIRFSRTVMAAVIPYLIVSAGGQQPTAEPVRIDNDDLGGVVTGARGPEAGVWRP